MVDANRQVYKLSVCVDPGSCNSSAVTHAATAAASIATATATASTRRALLHGRSFAAASLLHRLATLACDALFKGQRKGCLKSLVQGPLMVMPEWLDGSNMKVGPPWTSSSACTSTSS